MWAFGDLENHSDNLPHISHLPAMHSTQQLEGLAVNTHEKLRIALPVDAFQLADACDLLLTPVSRVEEGFEGREIKYNGRAPHREQQAYVALCIARHLLQRDGYFPDHMAVAQLARALMLPRRELARGLQGRTSLASLRRQHPHAMTQWICARVGDLYNLNSSGPAAKPSSGQKLGAARKPLALAPR